MVDEQALVASPPTPPSTLADEAVHWLQSLEGDMERLLDALPDMPDEKLEYVIIAANQLNLMSWRVRAAAAHQILSRAEKRNRTGKPDTEGHGEWAVACKVAPQFGIEAQTLLRDAAIHATFFTKKDEPGTFIPGDKAYDKVLTERGFYVEALNAAYRHKVSAHQVLEEFIEAKMANPNFSVSDARRMARAGAPPELDALMPPLLGDPHFESAFSDFKKAARALAQVSSRRLGGMLRQYITEIEEEAKDVAISWLDKIEELVWREKYDNPDALATRLNVDREWPIHWFNQLQEKGWMTWTEKERTETARGAAAKQWEFTQKYWDDKLKRRPEDKAWI